MVPSHAGANGEDPRARVYSREFEGFTGIARLSENFRVEHDGLDQGALSPLVYDWRNSIWISVCYTGGAHPLGDGGLR